MDKPQNPIPIPPDSDSQASGVAASLLNPEETRASKAIVKSWRKMNGKLTAPPRPLTSPSSLGNQIFRENISCAGFLSNRERYILLLATFIPRGSFTTYRAMGKWARDAGDRIYERHVSKLLRKLRRYNDNQNIPLHRIVKNKGGRDYGYGGSDCDWGTHLPGINTATRIALFKREKTGYNEKDRTLTGTAVVFHGFEQYFKGTVMEKYITKDGHLIGLKGAR